MSKFATPKTGAKAAAKSVEDVLKAAPNDDMGADAAPAENGDEEVRFTMTMPRSMADAIDAAAKGYGLKRIAWLRVAAKEKLTRES